MIEEGVEGASAACAQRLHLTAGGMAGFHHGFIHRGVKNEGKQYIRRLQVFLNSRTTPPAWSPALAANVRGRRVYGRAQGLSEYAFSARTGNG